MLGSGDVHHKRSVPEQPGPALPGPGLAWLGESWVRARGQESLDK